MQDNKLIGWILIGPSKDQFTDQMIGFIYELYVVEEFRGQGTAKELLRNAVEQLKLKGYPEIHLSVFTENTAIQLYRELGFTERNITLTLSL